MENQALQHKTVTDSLSKESESMLKKYQGIYVGDGSILNLIKYEILTTFFSPIPGAVGFFLRKMFYKKLFGHIGSGAILGPYLTLRCPGQVQIGNGFIADGNVVLDAKGDDSAIELGDAVFLAKNTIFSCASATIKLGNEVSVGPHCYIRASRAPVILGSYITSGAHTAIISGNPGYARRDIPMMKQEGEAKGIIIGDDVWMGVGVRIIDGVTIGDGCIIGAGAVVTKDIPDYSIAVGVPAKVVGNRE